MPGDGRFVFKEEQNEYRIDGIDVENIEFTDNQHCLDLIEGKGGLLKMIDEEMFIPKGNDQTLLTCVPLSFTLLRASSHRYSCGNSKMLLAFSAPSQDPVISNMQPYFGCIRQRPNVFIVKHYAGE